MLATSLNPQTRHFNLAETRHLNFGLTFDVEAILKCRGSSKIQMSGLRVGFGWWVRVVWQSFYLSLEGFLAPSLAGSGVSP